MIDHLCAAAAAAHSDAPCDGDRFGLVLRYEPTDFGGTMGCPHHTALLQAQHPGSVIVPAAESIRTMSVFANHPDLVAMDEDG
ncbi:hypothetical protein AB0P17_15500 [Streptomyces sp. NPDC088124]|uniref:hypothetical protein n=1 Tax=Streptomyces sp. NPDC088124 TaxID=3154654 RepID=UPI00341E0AB4